MLTFVVLSKNEFKNTEQGGGGGGGGDEVWDRETMFSQLATRSPRVVVSGKLQHFSHIKYF